MSAIQHSPLDDVVNASSNFIRSSLMLRAGLRLSNTVLAFVTENLGNRA